MPPVVPRPSIAVVGKAAKVSESVDSWIQVTEIAPDLLSIIDHIPVLLAADHVFFVDDGTLFDLPTDEDRLDELIRRLAIPYATPDAYNLTALADAAAEKIAAVFAPRPSGRRDIWFLFSDRPSPASKAITQSFLDAPLVLTDSDPSTPLPDPYLDPYGWADVDELIDQLYLHHAAHDVTRWLPVPQLGSLLLAVLGPEAYDRLLIPGTGECFDDDGDLQNAPREQTSRNAVGFEVGNDNKAIRTIWLNASSTTRTMDEVVAGCLTAAINLTGEQRQAQAEWHASVRAKTSIDVLLKKRGKDNPIIGSSPALLQIYPKVLQAVQDPKAHVLVVGETGTGKEVVYELLRLLSPKNKPFEIYQLSGARGNDVKSDVFGHVEGAYTGSHGVRQGAVARAEGGTLVLDNAQTYGLDVFADLLRFLQKGQPYRVYGDDEEKHANCRVVVGFNVEPEELEEKEKLPLDWRARFDIRIDVPSLDDRREDIPALVHAFTAEFQRERKFDSVEAIKPPAHQVSLWMSELWSGSNGNVRGLRGAVHNYCRDRLAAGHSRSTPEPATGDQTVPEPRRRGRPPAVPHEQLFKILDKAAVEQWEYRRLAEALPQDYQDPTKLRRRVRDIGKKEDPEKFDIPKVLAYLDRVLPPACGGAGQKAH